MASRVARWLLTIGLARALVHVSVSDQQADIEKLGGNFEEEMEAAMNAVKRIKEKVAEQAKRADEVAEKPKRDEDLEEQAKRAEEAAEKAKSDADMKDAEDKRIKEAKAKRKKEVEAKRKESEDRFKREIEEMRLKEAEAKANHEWPRRVAPTKAYGDPHLQNVLGQRFDLMKPGHHTLVQIPQGGSHQKTLLNVAARVNRLGAFCQDMYITEVNVTGAWPESVGHNLVQFQAGVVHRDQDGKWLQFGPVDIKVVHGRTAGDTVYLNFLVRHLARAGYTVGGLLGEDDHTDAATTDGACKHESVSLLQGGEVVQVSARSEAEAEIETVVDSGAVARSMLPVTA